MPMPTQWAFNAHPTTGAAYAPMYQVLNDLGESIRTWYGNVNANGNDLTNVDELYVTTIRPRAGNRHAFRNAGIGEIDFNEVTLANNATVALETLIGGSNGTLWITSTSDGTVFGAVAIRGGIAAVVEMLDPLTTISTSDAGVQICVLSDGDGTYTLKNRLGSTNTITLAFFGQ